MITILTDSTADLGNEISEKFCVPFIPMYVFHNDQTYIDGVNISLETLFGNVAKTGQLPKTSAPTVADFAAAFNRPGEIVYIGLSSQLSATLPNALLAKKEFGLDRVYIVDTRNLSSGIGLLALKAADLRDQGLTAQEIYKQVSEMVPKVRTSFMIETLDYLYKGGRCSAMQNLVGSLLHIRPVIAVREDGTLGVKARLRRTRLKVLRSLLDSFCADLPNINLERVMIPHTACDEEAAYLKEEILKIAPVREVHLCTAGSVIASHCGPGTVGLSYMLN
jgi:DegV family protein with EDD domain